MSDKVKLRLLFLYTKIKTCYHVILTKLYRFTYIAYVTSMCLLHMQCIPC